MEEVGGVCVAEGTFAGGRKRSAEGGGDDDVGGLWLEEC